MSKDVSQTEWIPFNLPWREESNVNYVVEAINSSHRHGSGVFTSRAVALLKEITGTPHALLTHSCTGALELAMLLMDVGPGDEVIMPSYTFTSTANAVVLRGATPVFADINPRTQCVDPESVRALITPNTRALLPVHYAGIACDMNALCDIADEHNLMILEDAAQTIGSSLNGIALGRYGALGALSFHDSKNISCGEGGALLINDAELAKRAEILWEKGTNRSQFMRGEVDKYTWCDLGSSFLPSDITAAFLTSQLEKVELINDARRHIWNRYYDAFSQWEAAGQCRRPHIPDGCIHNAHIFYLILPTLEMRNEFLAYMKAHYIAATFHYVPLHACPAGLKYGRAPLPLPNTLRAGSGLVRLPLFPTMSAAQQDKVLNVADEFFQHYAAKKSRKVELLEA